MKIKIIAIALLATLTLCIGCASTTPPTKLESSIFNVVTNHVTVVQTNTLWTTNISVQTVTLTNNTQVNVTNTYAVPIPIITTNIVTTVDYQQGENAAKIKATASQIGSVAGGPLGETIAGFAATAILGIWGWWRSNNKSKLAINSMQVIETLRQFVKSLPDGAKYDSALVAWMQKHQGEAGVIQSVVDTLAADVSSSDAKTAAATITAAITALGQPTAPAPKT